MPRYSEKQYEEARQMVASDQKNQEFPKWCLSIMEAIMTIVMICVKH